MDTPVWLVEILRQFPIVVVIGFAVWYAEKRMREKEVRLETRSDAERAALQARADEQERQLRAREDQLRKESRDDRDAEIKRFLTAQREVRESHEKLLAAKDEQIEHLTRQLAALNRKLQG